MSSSLPRAYGEGRRTRKYVMAVRAGNRGSQRIVTQGHLVCVSCGGSALSMAEFAEIAGVNARDVSDFLNRRPVREDKAQKIRDNVIRVDE